MVFYYSVKLFEDMIVFMFNLVSEVSYYVLIVFDGVCCMLVCDDCIVWYVGVFVFWGCSCCNDFFFGLVFVGDMYVVFLMFV